MRRPTCVTAARRRARRLDKDDYVPASLDYVTWDGKLWAIPYRIETHGVFYNKGAFKAAGLDPEKPPQTWTELVDVATKLTGKGANGQDQFGFAITGGGEFGNTVFRSLPFIWMNGGSIISDDMKKATVNQPAAVEAVTFYTDFLKKGLSPPSTLQNDGTANRRLFIAETVAMYQSGQFDVGSIRKENPNIDIGVMMIPHPEGKETAGDPRRLELHHPEGRARTPRRRRSSSQFLAESDNMGFFTDTFPARISAMNLPRFEDPILVGVQGRCCPSAARCRRTRTGSQITQAYFDGMQRILLGDATPQEAMDDGRRGNPGAARQ